MYINYKKFNIQAFNVDKIKIIFIVINSKY